MKGIQLGWWRWTVLCLRRAVSSKIEEIWKDYNLTWLWWRRKGIIILLITVVVRSTKLHWRLMATMITSLEIIKKGMEVSRVVVIVVIAMERRTKRSRIVIWMRMLALRKVGTLFSVTLIIPTGQTRKTVTMIRRII